MAAPTIVVIGAGSRSFGLYTLRALLAEPRLEGANVTLVDLDAQRLEEAVRLGKMSLSLKAEDFSILGPPGRCEIKDLRAYK